MSQTYKNIIGHASENLSMLSLSLLTQIFKKCKETLKKKVKYFLLIISYNQLNSVYCKSIYQVK